jgi:hypothetical protein
MLEKEFSLNPLVYLDIKIGQEDGKQHKQPISNQIVIVTFDLFAFYSWPDNY